VTAADDRKRAQLCYKKEQKHFAYDTHTRVVHFLRRKLIYGDVVEECYTIVIQVKNRKRYGKRISYAKQAESKSILFKRQCPLSALD